MSVGGPPNSSSSFSNSLSSSFAQDRSDTNCPLFRKYCRSTSDGEANDLRASFQARQLSVSQETSSDPLLLRFLLLLSQAV